MRTLQVLTALLLFVSSVATAADCAAIRYGYYDQHRPPYYMGTGNAEANPPGASVELAREAMHGIGCPMHSVRLPYLRMVRLLESAEIDAAQIDAIGQNVSKLAFPLDASGKPDKGKALQLVTIVFVRARDNIPKDVHPAAYFKGKKVGVVLGAPYADALRKSGIEIDDGAQEMYRNLEKLASGRIDGFAGAVISPGDLDAYVEKRFGKELVRLDTPLRTAYLWLAFSKEYHAQHQAQVEQMWHWYGSQGRRRLIDIVKTYDAQD